MEASIIITSFQRSHLLNWGLMSLAKQEIPFEFETIVINDAFEDETAEICRQYEQRLNLKYIFAGQRNLYGELKWRVPGYAINIGARQSKGEILIISCAEMYHINDTIARLVKPLIEDRKLIGIPLGKDDQDSSFLNYVVNNLGGFDESLFEAAPSLNVRLPFLMSMTRDQFFEIGGYDEDFTGIAYDDNDFVERLLDNGCTYFQTDAKTVHLYHPRFVYGKEEHPDLLYNKKLYLSKKGQIIRNEHREWGKLCGI